MVDCAKYQGSLREAWLDGAFYEAVVCPYDAAMGELAFGLVVYSALTFGLYIRTGTAADPVRIYNPNVSAE